MSLKYYLGVAISIPLLPVLFYQGKQVRKKVPELPEAMNPQGNAVVSGEKPIQLISLGESTIAGVGVNTHEEGFTGTFAKEFSQLQNRTVNWRVYAKSGYTAKRVLNELVPTIEEREVDIILIGLGGNDTFRLNHPKKWKFTARKLIKTLQEQFPKAFIVFINMPPFKESPVFTPLIKFTLGNLVEILGQELKSLTKEFDNVVFFEDVIVLEEWIERYQMDAVPNDFFSDGVHPSKLTYQTFAKDLALRVSKLKKFD
jgi:lysophospholipase L1-like esterase